VSNQEFCGRADHFYGKVSYWFRDAFEQAYYIAFAAKGEGKSLVVSLSE
jgi:hypothetical protein